MYGAAAQGTEVGQQMNNQFQTGVGMYGTAGMCRQVEAANAEQQVETTGQVEQAGEQEQNPSTSEDPDISERVAKKVVKYMQAAEKGKIEEPKKKPPVRIRNEHLLSKMDEILTEVRKLQL